MLPRALGERFGADILAKAVFACDASATCQAHIQRMGEVEVLFGDVGEISLGKAKNLMTGKAGTLVPEADLLAAGTSCVNMSTEKLAPIHW